MFVRTTGLKFQSKQITDLCFLEMMFVHCLQDYQENIFLRNKLYCLAILKLLNLKPDSLFNIVFIDGNMRELTKYEE